MPHLWKKIPVIISISLLAVSGVFCSLDGEEDADVFLPVYELEYVWGDKSFNEQAIQSAEKMTAPQWRSFRLPHQPPGRKGNTGLWVRMIPPKSDFKSPAMMISSIHQVFQVYSGDKLIYAFGDFDSTGKGIFAGHKWHHIIPLPKNYHEKPVYFRIYSIFQSIGFSSIVIGDKSELIISIVRRDIHKLILGVFIALVGLMALVYYLLGSRKKIDSEPIDKSIYLFFSIFTTFMGIAIVSDTAIKELILDAPMMWIHVRLVSMIGFGFGLIGFLIQIEELRYKVLLKGLLYVFIAYALISFLLISLKVITVMEIILPYNIILLGSIPIVFFCILTSSLRANVDAIIIGAGFSILILAGIRDAIMDMGLLPRSGFIHHWAVFIFIASLGVVLFRRFDETHNRYYEYQQSIELARNIQWSNLPVSLPAMERICIAAKYLPMQRIGGDFYGFHEIDSSRIGVLLTDVSGHGIPSAMVSSMIKLSFDLVEDRAHDPSALLCSLNKMLINNIEKNFITACYCFLDLSGMNLYVGNAGHPAIFLWKCCSNMLEAIRPRGMFLGRFPNIDFVTEKHPLEAGDKIIIYTDGITETMNKKGELFGEERLASFIEKWHHIPAEEFVERLLAHVQNWSERSGKGFDDDLTIIVIDLKK